jgi:signal-transduction protein with cAMP-binding, CBS, and nucleotidyltransferase domain
LWRRKRWPTIFYVIIKGSVEERDGDGELAALLGPGDSFDSRALMQGSGARSFVAREETLCLPAAARHGDVADRRRTRASARFSISTSRASSTKWRATRMKAVSAR